VLFVLQKNKGGGAYGNGMGLARPYQY